MVRTQNLALGVLLASTLLTGCSQTSYEGCSGPGGEDVQEVLRLMLDAVEQQSSTTLCLLFQEPIAQTEADGFVAEMSQRISDNGGIESIEIAQVDQGGSSKEFEVTNTEGAILAEFSVVQNSRREYLNITDETFGPMQ